MNTWSLNQGIIRHSIMAIYTTTRLFPVRLLNPIISIKHWLVFFSTNFLWEVACKSAYQGWNSWQRHFVMGTCPVTIFSWSRGYPTGTASEVVRFELMFDPWNEWHGQDRGCAWVRISKSIWIWLHLLAWGATTAWGSSQLCEDCNDVKTSGDWGHGSGAQNWNRQKEAGILQWVVNFTIREWSNVA